MLFLNLFEGVSEQARLDKIVSYIKKEDPEIICLAEACCWEKNKSIKLKNFKKNINCNYHYFHMSPIGESLVIFSKTPFIKKFKIKPIIPCSIMKCSLKINNININIFLAHLTARDEQGRIREIELILKKIDKKSNTILLGDLNSLSPLDKYNEKKLLKKLKKLNIVKFGEGILKKDVQTKILKFGLIDTIKKFSKKLEHTVPTKFNKDKYHCEKLRLDYAYITLLLKKYLKSAKVIRTKETNQLSDHFPLVIEFEFS